MTGSVNKSLNIPNLLYRYAYKFLKYVNHQGSYRQLRFSVMMSRLMDVHTFRKSYAHSSKLIH